MVSAAYVSCTNDEEDTKPNKEKMQTFADDPTGGNQSGQTPIPPPRP